MSTVLANCSVVDVVSGQVAAGSGVWVEGNRIKAIGGSNELIADAEREGGRAPKVLDMGGAHVLPGLANMHVHFGLSLPGPDEFKMMFETESALVLRMANNAREALLSGVTTVRCPGEKKGADFSLRASINKGETIGPRIFTAGNAIISTGGHGHTRAGMVEADGPDEFRKLVRQQIKAGADFIKICISGGIAGEHEAIKDSQLLVDEMTAVMEVAHGWGKKVTAHAGPAHVIKQAVEVGLDCVEHGYFLTDEVTALMAERNTWLVPTISVSRCEEFYAKIGAPAWMVKKALEAGQFHWAGLQSAIRNGVNIALGTDMMPAEPFEGTTSTIREMEFMVEAGMTPAAVLKAATLKPAEWLGVADRQGTLEAGKLADIVAVDGDPTNNISAMRTLRFVMKDGQVVRHDRAAA